MEGLFFGAPFFGLAFFLAPFCLSARKKETTLTLRERTAERRKERQKERSDEYVVRESRILSPSRSVGSQNPKP